MSTFSGLNTAFSSLNAQRVALEVSGQNIANANTVGYTRQRAHLESVSGAQISRGTFSQPVGQGVSIKGIERLGNLFLDARVRSTGSSAAMLSARADAYARIESILNEPSDNGISHSFNELWSGFQEVAKSPQTLATKQVVLERSRAIASVLGNGYSALETQWIQQHQEITGQVAEINAAAASVAEFNTQIQLMNVSGGNASELIDQRQLVIQQLAESAGATARFREDGTVDVSVGGNILVSGNSAQKLAVTGPSTLQGVMGATAQTLQVVWERPGIPTVNFDGGEISGKLLATAPAGQGGLIAKAAQGYNDVATSLATSVNGLLAKADGGKPLFALGGDPAAKTLSVTLTGPEDLKVGAPNMGEFDGSIADEIAQLGSSIDGPSAQWKTFVVKVGVEAKSSATSAEVAYSAFETAATLQLSNASVDIDEETVNLLTYQRGYQAASRVLTTIDEMLDQLINRTGVVGR